MARKHGFFRPQLGIGYPQVASTTQREGGGDPLTADVIALFANGEQGGVYDFLTPSRLATTAAGSTRPAAVCDYVGQVDDLSGNAKHWTVASNLKRGFWISRARGVLFNGVNTSFITSSVDFSSTGKVTVITSFRKRREAEVGLLLELSPTFVTNAKTFGLTAAPQNGANGRGYGFFMNGATSPDLGAREVQTGYQSPRQDTVIFEFDLTGATISDRLRLTVNGSAPTLLDTLTGGTGTVFSNAAMYLGMRGGSTLPAMVEMRRMVVIGRELTSDEKTLVSNWCELSAEPLPAVRIITLGDSTVGGTANLGNTVSMPDVVTLISGLSDNSVAKAGQTIAQQSTRFDGVTSYSGYAAVVAQIGLNDMDPAEAASVAIARLQSLVNNIASKAPSAKIVLAQTLLCRQRWIDAYGATDGPTAYQKQLDFNDAIAGIGPNAITGPHARVTAHVPLLSDGSGNLAAAYDSGDHIHENLAGRQIIAAAWRDALVSVGVL